MATSCVLNLAFTPSLTLSLFLTHAARFGPFKVGTRTAACADSCPQDIRLPARISLGGGDVRASLGSTSAHRHSKQLSAGLGMAAPRAFAALGT